MSEKFINEDKNLLNLDFLVVSDTRLTKKDADDDLKDRNQSFIDIIFS